VWALARRTRRRPQGPIVWLILSGVPGRSQEEIRAICDRRVDPPVKGRRKGGELERKGDFFFIPEHPSHGLCVLERTERRSLGFKVLQGLF